MAGAFVKITDEGEKLIARNYVRAPGYSLEKELKDTYEYPVDGWTWEEDVEEEE
jgi:hypothetical protein